ncbi:GH32 C-terminal domain-containing protein [Arthrobacter sp. TWP1-1]|uniref:GH32 C-terminal domain-containing protein n=1 Tax=Arthrobacter sp. TWP1-1 TaxID=2804568 RepID=UPI003CFA2A53
MPISRRRFPLSFFAIAMICAVTLVLVLGAITTLVLMRPSEDTPRPANQSPTTDTKEFERPHDWSQYRPATHLTPAQNWMNDPQRPFFLNGLWHFYYLYNADYPEGNGTSWYHVTSTDLVHWKDEGVAIEKYTNGLGDIWTGSAVVDTQNTAGFGKDAVISLVTQQVDGVQRQSLFYSTDGGYSFRSYEGNPVMDNPGAEAWRDPKIVWDKERSQWLMLLAEGNKVGFYTSPNLKTWTYQSGFERSGLGVIECPDLFEMAVDGDPERTTWVLGISANGESTGRTTGYTYWTGSWDGKNFVPEQDDPRWLDAGSDFYAAVTWDDPNAENPLAQRYAIGWMNNWAYAGALPKEDWSGGSMSTVRQLTLRTVDGHPQLNSKPIDAVAELEGGAEQADAQQLQPNDSVSLPQPTTAAYRLRLTLAPDAEHPAKEARVKLEDTDGSFVTISYNFHDQTLSLARDSDTIAAGMPEAYRQIRSEKVPLRDGELSLDVVVDTASVEIFAQDGEASLSSVSVLLPGQHQLSVESLGGDTQLRSATLNPLAVAAPTR